MCNVMVREAHGGLSDSIEIESRTSAYVLSTSSHTIMQMWEETHKGAATVTELEGNVKA